MEKKEKNLQYRRTDKAIVNAFIKLMKSKSFHDIIVQDILDEALVSRYTFYKHYQDKFEIAEYLQDQVLQEFQRYKEKMINSSNDITFTHQQIDRMNHSLNESVGELFWIVSRIRTDRVDIWSNLRTFFTEHYLKNHEYNNSQLEAEIYASLQASLMKYYLEDSLHITATEYSEPILNAMLNVFLYMIGIHRKDAKDILLRMMKEDHK